MNTANCKSSKIDANNVIVIPNKHPDIYLRKLIKIRRGTQQRRDWIPNTIEKKYLISDHNQGEFKINAGKITSNSNFIDNAWLQSRDSVELIDFDEKGILKIGRNMR